MWNVSICGWLTWKTWFVLFCNWLGIKFWFGTLLRVTTSLGFLWCDCCCTGECSSTPGATDSKWPKQKVHFRGVKHGPTGRRPDYPFRAGRIDRNGHDIKVHANFIVPKVLSKVGHIVHDIKSILYFPKSPQQISSAQCCIQTSQNRTADNHRWIPHQSVNRSLAKPTRIIHRD